MQLKGRARKVTILVGQPGSEHGKQTYLRILERLKAEGAAGASAFKAIAAFGARAQVQTVRLADVVPDLPVMIVWIDTPERVERILPHIQSMVAEGLIAVEETEVLLYTTAAVPDLPPSVTVEDVMTRDVVAVQPETTMSELVADLVERQFRAVPVIDANRKVVGIVTNGDLVRRGGLPVRLDLLRTFDTPEMHEQLVHLATTHREARDIMTSPVLTVHPEMDVRHAAQLMQQHKLKRLPVVDSEERLNGIVSRVDLLCSVATRSAEPPQDRHPGHIEGTAPVRTIMSRAVPAVRADASLQEVLGAVLSTRLNRAVVVDEARHVLGIVTDSELTERLTPRARPGLRAMLTGRIPFVHGSHEAEEVLRHTGGKQARDLMVTDIVTAREDEPVRNVLAAMLQRSRKIVPIVNEAGELRGMVDRADLLRALVESQWREDRQHE